MRRKSHLLILLFLLSISSCRSDPEKPEQQAKTLQPFPVHTLPVGIRLDSLQKILHGHSALFLSMVPNRLFRIIPLNAYENQGYGAVELYPDSTIRTYYWYSNLDDLTQEQQRYYSAPRPTVDIKPVITALTAAYGAPIKLEPYPNEEWYNWRNDSMSINLTLQKQSITLTKTGPGAAIAKDTARSSQTPVAKKPTVKKPTAKKSTVKKPTVKKPVAKKSTVKKPAVKKKR